MNGHLDSEAICGWAAGERPAEAERHLRECAECAGALRRLEGGIAGFRDTASAWSERVRPEPPAAWQPATPAVRWRALVAITGLAASLTAAAVLVTAPIERGRERAAAAREAERERADALLLDRVDAALSRSAPAPMEPLTHLVATTGEKQ